MLTKYRKYRTIALYLAFGGLTTLVNIITYFSLTKILGVQYIASNVAAWITSVLFAYVTNRLFVFASKGKGLIFIIRECSAFIGCRMFSGLVDTTTMYVMIDLLHFNDLFVKIIANISVIILNYGFSKRVVFQDKGQGEVVYGENINRSALL
ncbi:MAG TPA: GtrA family protein [Syntrophomonadaceae bacterium]|nr:GtrA family protein [Syntrophomonadaceae bacterium]